MKWDNELAVFPVLLYQYLVSVYLVSIHCVYRMEKKEENKKIKKIKKYKAVNEEMERRPPKGGP